MYQIDDKLMMEIVRRIVATARPEKVILFGSRARGDARLDSDLDLLIVAADPQPRSLRASALYGVLSDIMIPMDILVYRPEEIEEWRNVPQAFVTTAVREGSILYECHA
jgi:predicted nucleotidyltransferase